MNCVYFWIVGGKFLFLLCVIMALNNTFFFVKNEIMTKLSFIKELIDHFLGCILFYLSDVMDLLLTLLCEKRMCISSLLVVIAIFVPFFFSPFLVRWWSVFLSLLSFPLVIIYLVLEQISNVMLRFCLHLDYYILIQESLR